MAESSPLFGFDPGTTTVVGDYGKVAEAQGDIADAAAQSKSQQAPFDFLGLGTQVSQLAGKFAEQKNMVDAHQAKLRATEFMQENDYLTGHELATKVEEQIRTISDGNNYSSGYRKGALAVFDIGYAQALERKEEERVASAMNVLASNFSTEIADNRANGIPMNEEYAQDWASRMSTEFRVPIEYVRNAMVSSYYQDAQMRVATATTPAQLAAAQSYINEASTVLRSPLFLDSRSRRFQPIINSLRSNLDSSISAKQTEFRQQAALRVVTELEGDQTDVYSSYPSDPRTPENIALIQASTTSPAAAARKLRELTAGYEEAQTARSYLASYNPMDVHAPIPSVSENKYIQPAIEEMVYASVLQNIENPARLASIAANNPEVIGTTGDRLLHAFMTTNDEGQLQQFNSYFANATSVPGGSRAMQLMFGDDYKDVVGINVLASTFTHGDVGRARDVLAEAQGSLVSPPIDPSIASDYYENAASLGTLGDEYMYSINTLLRVSPGLVNKQMLNRVYDLFAEGYQERAGVNFNVSRYDSANSARDPEVFNEQLASMATTFNGGVTPGEVFNLPGDIMVYKDEFGFTAGVFDAGPVLAVSNGLAEALSSNDTKNVNFFTRSGDTMDALTSWVADAATTNLFDREGQLAADNRMYANLAEIWSGEDVSAEMISTVILDFKAMFPDVITSEQVPDPVQRAAMQQRNIEIQHLIDEVAARYTPAGSLDAQVEADANYQEMIDNLNNGFVISP
ncbi:hypothetical protein CRP143_gp49 [Roseobacter phage CRP-143]|nr:hypothetical protein CRP143_gp49 [Roseobacter phage CRP-143]